MPPHDAAKHVITLAIEQQAKPDNNPQVLYVVRGQETNVEQVSQEM